MKIICILQNAWGNRELPTVFKPNPGNKSAKVIKKMVGEGNDFYFCNTTDVVTSTAAGRAPIKDEHFNKVILSLALTQITDYPYGFILVCGRQAEKAVQANVEKLKDLKIPILIVPHPASRSLSNIQINKINKIIKTYESRKFPFRCSL